MSESDRRQQPTAKPTSKPAEDPISSGTRRAQKMGGREGCIGSNLTKTGAQVLDITHKQLLRVEVYQNGIWIEPVEDK
ncbi:MAG: hypothetical protein ABEI98_02530 [Halorhabdus sp.]